MNDHGTNRMRFASTGRESRPARWSAACAAAICAALVAACGGSSQPPDAGPGGGPLLAYARCMRAHGVPGFPDPRATGGLVIPNDMNPQSPAFQAAGQACAKLGRNSQGQRASSQSDGIRLLALARCMRAHGVPSFQDPTRSPPPPSRGNAIGGGGWYLSLGTTPERQSPAYGRAARACGATMP